MDVAKALTAGDFTEMQQILDKYSVTHVLVCTDDLYKATWIYKSAGLEPSDYVVVHDSEVEFTEVGMQTMIAKLLENRDTGLTLIYEDEEIKIYN
jgi:sulfur relay (sulfurtransferase) DsrF/TusC family protein